VFPADPVCTLGELAFWLPPESNIVVYSGSVAARAMLQVGGGLPAVSLLLQQAVGQTQQAVGQTQQAVGQT